MKPKKKVVYIMHTLATGGVEIAFVSALPELVKVFDLTVILLGDMQNDLSNQISDEIKQRFITFDYPVWSYPLQVGKIANRILVLNPEIVVCSLWRSAWIGVSLKRKQPNLKCVIFLHSTGYPHPLARYFNKKATGVADFVFTDSQSTLEFAREIFSPKGALRKISFLTQPSPPANTINEIDYRKNIKMVFLGRLARVKNLPFTLKVIKQLVEKDYNITLDIYGRADEDFPNIQKKVIEYNLGERIFYRGEVEHHNVFTIFSRYHFYIQHSFNEGMAMSVAEAMQVGLPCIVSPVGEIPNYSKDMDSAIFFPNEENEEYGKALKNVEKVLRNPELHRKISQTCFRNFQHKSIYRDSIIKELSSIG